MCHSHKALCKVLLQRKEEANAKTQSEAPYFMKKSAILWDDQGDYLSVCYSSYEPLE